MRPAISNFKFQISNPGRSRRRGYVLIVTMGLLVLAAGLMVAVSRAALRHATAARLAADEVQHRWGVASCRSAVLPYADEILLALEAEIHDAAPVARARVQLGGETFELTVADEWAKANVNVLLDHSERSAAEERLRQSLTGTGLLQNVRLRPSAEARVGDPSSPATAPATKPAGGNVVPQYVSGFGQVFEDASPERLLATQGGVRPSELLTCWGGGRVNLRRVSPAVLKVVAGTAVSGVDQGRLLAVRDLQNQGKPVPPLAKGDKTSDPVARLLRMAKVDGKGIDKLPPLLLESKCHSVWIVARDKRRTWHYLSILDRSDNDHPRATAFVW